MLDIGRSKGGVPIRLTDERWAHITEEHCEISGLCLEVLDTIENPDRILVGSGGECLAVREFEREYSLLSSTGKPAMVDL